MLWASALNSTSFTWERDCGTPLQVRPGIRIASGITITLEGNTAGPCPKCGARGHIPNGTFNSTDGAVRVLAAPQRTMNQLRTLALILEDARAGRIDPQEAIGPIEETVPTLSALRRPAGIAASQLIGTLAVLISTIIAMGILFADYPSQPPVIHSTEINIEEMNNSIQRGPSEAERDKLLEMVYGGLCDSEESC